MRLTRQLALASYLALLALIVAWEVLLAPVTPLPRAFWAALKTVPLLLLMVALLRGSARAYVFAALLVLLYFCEGVAVGYSAARKGSAPEFLYACAEVMLALIFIGSASFYARFTLRKANARSPV